MRWAIAQPHICEVHGAIAVTREDICEARERRRSRGHSRSSRGDPVTHETIREAREAIAVAHEDTCKAREAIAVTRETIREAHEAVAVTQHYLC